MFEILHDLTINAEPKTVIKAVTEPQLLNQWWTVSSEGEIKKGGIYRFYFSDEYDWKAELVKLDLHHVEYKMISADEDWNPTSFGFTLKEVDGACLLSFYHSHWKSTNHHFRRTSFCWAMYLMKLKKLVEE